MTREEAARVLTELADEYEKYELSKNGWLGTTYIPAHRMGVAALREPAHEWVRTTDRLPMVEQVVVGLCGGKFDIYQMVNIDDFKRYVEYWCALPLLPEVEG